MTHPVREMFLAQAAGCEGLGSPLTARVLRLLAAGMQPDGQVASAVLGWQGDLSRHGDALALRLAGGLHALVLTGAAPALAAFYRAPDALSDAEATALLLATLRGHQAPLLAYLQSPPQTNEVRRSVALIAAGHWLTDRFKLPIVISELGASAGLNLNWDRYALDLPGQSYGAPDSPLRLSPDWKGPLPPHSPPHVAARAGVDLRPLNPATDTIRILSYIWADQPDRLARTRAAMALADTAVQQGDAVDWLDGRLKQRHPGHLHLIFHTIAWQYFPPMAQVRGRDLLAKAGAQATEDAPLAHLAMEADGLDDGAALTLQIWPSGQVIPLARVDFHGRWLRWADQVT